MSTDDVLTHIDDVLIGHGAQVDAMRWRPPSDPEQGHGPIVDGAAELLAADYLDAYINHVNNVRSQA